MKIYPWAGQRNEAIRHRSADPFVDSIGGKNPVD